MKKLAELLRLDARVAVITGRAGPLARAHAEVFAECGAKVVIVDRIAENCEERAPRDRFATAEKRRSPSPSTCPNSEVGRGNR